MADDSEDTPSLSGFFQCAYELREWVIGGCVLSLESSPAASTDFDKTGQVIWQAAVLAAHYVAHPPVAAELARAGALLELGAGAGLSGFVASCVASPLDCWLTDFEPEVLDLLRRNAAHVASGSGGAAPCAACRVADLSWGSSRDHDALAAAAGRSQWPIILGADVVFWSESITPLFDSVSALLAPRGTFILSFTERRNGLRDTLEAAARRNGFVWSTVELESFLPAPIPTGLDGHLHRMTLYRFTRG